MRSHCKIYHNGITRTMFTGAQSLQNTPQSFCFWRDRSVGSWHRQLYLYPTNAAQFNIWGSVWVPIPKHRSAHFFLSWTQHYPMDRCKGYNNVFDEGSACLLADCAVVAWKHIDKIIRIDTQARLCLVYYLHSTCARDWMRVSVPVTHVNSHRFIVKYLCQYYVRVSLEW